MATIKSYTDLNQSRKLAEILPLESADMYYWCGEDLRIGGHRAMDIDYDVPCWSLSALLGIIPKRIKECNVLRIDLNRIDFSIWYDELGYGVNTELPDITKKQPIDACVAMIEKLHERNLL